MSTMNSKEYGKKTSVDYDNSHDVDSKNYKQSLRDEVINNKR